MADKLRDLSQPIDVPLLDATVSAFYGTGSKEEVTTFSVSPPAQRLRVYLLLPGFRDDLVLKAC
jgi:hypothetical protein